jgi:hypothetical protein
MIATLLLAASSLAASHTPTRSLDQRVALLEARQLLESQTLWGLQSTLTPEALKAVSDIELHVQIDRERDEALRALAERLAALEQRLASVELLLGDRPLAEGTLRVVPPQQAQQAQQAQIGEPLIRSRKPVAKSQPPAKAARARKPGAEQAAAPRLSDAGR